MNQRIWLRPPILGCFTGRFKAELLPEHTDLIMPAEIGLDTHESSAEIPLNPTARLRPPELDSVARGFKAGLRPEPTDSIKAADTWQCNPQK